MNESNSNFLENLYHKLEKEKTFHDKWAHFYMKISKLNTQIKNNPQLNPQISYHLVKEKFESTLEKRKLSNILRESIRK